MGCDGGTIPRRDELVKTKQKPEQKDKNAERLYRWRHCAISQTQLKYPIVACELGRLYNKEEVITRLIEKVKEPTMLHIKNLKDIKELVLTTNPSYHSQGATLGDGVYVDNQSSEYICPVTGQEMNGKYNFYFIWTCGCVVSERAMKEIKSNNCHVCNKFYLQDDVIPLNPKEEELIHLAEMMAARRAKAKAAKKEAKRSAEQTGDVSKKQKKDVNKGASTSGVFKANGSVINGAVTSVLKDSEFHRIRSSEFSVAKDKTKSEIFKSIFDTHKTAQNKSKAHWVTCNPQYF